MKTPSEILPSSPSYNVREHLKYVQDLHAKYRYNDEEKCVKFIHDFIRSLDLPEDIIDLCADTMYAILDHDNLFVPFEPRLENRDYLIQLQAIFTEPKIFDEAVDVFRSLFIVLKAHYPKGRSSAKIPFVQVLPDAKRVIALTAKAFASTEVYGVPVFFYTKSTLEHNLTRFDDDLSSGTPPEDLARILFHETFVLDFFTEKVSFTIPREIWEKHGIIIAPPGHGKTQLLGSFVSNFLQAKERVGCIVLDPHGDLYETISKRVPADRLIEINPDVRPPSLNFLSFGESTEAEALQTFHYLISSLSGGLTEKQSGTVPYMLKLLRAVPDASIDTLRQLVDEKVKSATNSKFAPYYAKLPSVDLDFFNNVFYHPSMDITKQSIAWKLYSCLSSNAFRTMFSAPTNSLDMDACLREQKVVIVHGSRSSLGDEGMRVFLQFIIAQYFAAGLRRSRIPKADRSLNVMFIDEASYILSSNIIKSILVELRKYSCGLCMATQIFEQIGPDIRASILGATAIKIAGPVQFSDSNVLARDMATTGEFIRSMRARERESADWAVHLQGMDSAIKLTVPYGTLEALPVIQKPVESKNDFKEAVARTSPTPAPEVQSPAATTPDHESPATGANSQSTPPPDDDPYKATKLT